MLCRLLSGAIVFVIVAKWSLVCYSSVQHADFHYHNFIKKHFLGHTVEQFLVIIVVKIGSRLIVLILLTTKPNFVSWLLNLFFNCNLNFAPWKVVILLLHPSMMLSARLSKSKCKYELCSKIGIHISNFLIYIYQYSIGTSSTCIMNFLYKSFFSTFLGVSSLFTKKTRI